MLDKSIPYVDVIMHRKKETPIPYVELPDGFIFSHFRDGDEKTWAEIEASVLEFPNISDEKNLGNYANDNYERAIEILRKISHDK